MNRKKAIKILTIVLVLSLLGAIAGTAYYVLSGNEQKTTTNTTPARTEPLPAIDRQQVIETIEQSPFTQDVPKKGVISLRFYKFDEGERVWQDRFLIGPGTILSSGEPDLSIIMHSSYIGELQTRNLCDVIQEAQRNGDFAVDLKRNKAILLAKYAGMMEHRSCLGF